MSDFIDCDNPHFIAYLARKHQEYGDKFDTSELDTRFIEYFHKDIRIKIDNYGTIEHGTVSVTTGWKPIFLLIHRKSDYGSSTTLSRNQKILGYKRSNMREYAIFRESV